APDHGLATGPWQRWPVARRYPGTPGVACCPVPQPALCAGGAPACGQERSPSGTEHGNRRPGTRAESDDCQDPGCTGPGTTGERNGAPGRPAPACARWCEPACPGPEGAPPGLAWQAACDDDCTGYSVHVRPPRP